MLEGGARLAARLAVFADEVAAAAGPGDPRWRQALRAVPRHLFIPRSGWAAGPGGRSRAIDQDADAPGWWDAVYANEAITVQSDDGAADPAAGTGTPTAAASQPDLVLTFLDLLDVQDGDRVLEIGTGTGWTAALLSWRVGAGSVTSVEIDPAVAALARGNLTAAGYAPHLVTGDGAVGWPDRAPYDRVHVTCGVETIPAAWIEQTRPGGRIVLPWMPGGPLGYQLHLDVLGNGTATGRCHDQVSYMMLRAQRRERVWNPHHPDQAVRGTTRLDPRAVARAGPAAELLIVTQVPGIGWFAVPDSDGSFALLLYEVGRPGGSWAECDYTPGCRDFEVTQSGPRRLWDEVSASYLRWLSLGRPTLDRFGLTVSSAGLRVWLDRPGVMLLEPGAAAV